MRLFPEPNPLTLRPLPVIGLGYFAGALAGGFAGALGLLPMSADELESLAASGQNPLWSIVESIIIIGLLCLVMEVIIATPLLVLYRLGRWRYLTRWTAALLGLVIGAAPMILLLSVPLGDGTSEPLGYFSLGHLTAAGWFRLFKGAAWGGCIGAASAGVLASIAVRKRAERSEPTTPQSR
jgi:hypothetical protein